MGEALLKKEGNFVQRKQLAELGFKPKLPDFKVYTLFRLVPPSFRPIPLAVTQTFRPTPHPAYLHPCPAPPTVNLRVGALPAALTTPAGATPPGTSLLGLPWQVKRQQRGGGAEHPSETSPTLTGAPAPQVLNPELSPPWGAASLQQPERTPPLPC